VIKCDALHICSSVAAVERVSSFRYLGVHIAEDLTWTTHIDTRLYRLRQLRKF